jgi:hypothetical protein
LATAWAIEPAIRRSLNVKRIKFKFAVMRRLYCLLILAFCLVSSRVYSGQAEIRVRKLAPKVHHSKQQYLTAAHTLVQGKSYFRKTGVQVKNGGPGSFTGSCTIGFFRPFTPWLIGAVASRDPGALLFMLFPKHHFW